VLSIYEALGSIANIKKKITVKSNIQPIGNIEIWVVNQIKVFWVCGVHGISVSMVICMVVYTTNPR
jgi:hypothetical protein